MNISDPYYRKTNNNNNNSVDGLTTTVRIRETTQKFNMHYFMCVCEHSTMCTDGNNVRCDTILET